MLNETMCISHDSHVTVTVLCVPVCCPYLEIFLLVFRYFLSTLFEFVSVMSSHPKWNVTHKLNTCVLPVLG